MMPLWTMTLGRLILIDGHIIVPYRNIATLAAGLVIPLMVILCCYYSNKQLLKSNFFIK